MKSKVTGINFVVGKIVKCVETSLDLKDTYFKIIKITNNEIIPDDVILELLSIDKRYDGNNTCPRLYAYRFEKAGQEYIILKLKGVVE